MSKTMGEAASRLSDDPRIADREHVDTPMGEVCMSRAEEQAYREALEMRELLQGIDGKRGRDGS